MSDLITQALNELAFRINEKKVKVTVDEKMPKVYCDRRRIVQVFVNLIDNAIKCTPPGGEVAIALEKIGTDAVITIKDTGVGISKENIPKIFERFYRVDKSRSRKLGGSGLGLSISKWIVELHSGDIQVESEVDKGSTFTITIPMS